MRQQNLPGRPPTLNEEILERILKNAPSVLIDAQIAKLSHIPRQTFSDWLRRGEDDFIKGSNTIFAQLSDNLHHIKAKTLKGILNEIREGTDNYKALIWMVEKCFREDFGTDSEEMRELRKLFEQLILSKGIANG